MANEVVMTKVLDAPRGRVFRAWTDAQELAQWWGPHGFTIPRCELDARPGGAIRVDMRAPDGTVHAMGGEFREIVILERIVFVTSALDAAGRPMFEFLHEIDFSDEGAKAKLVTRSRLLTTTPQAAHFTAGFQMGWTQQMERLAEYVKH